ncbi:MAG: 30S ribosomal protein S1 [Ardenticatenaceae bacterium]
MTFLPPWELDFDEGYWNAVVTQGQWAEGSPPPKSDAFATSMTATSTITDDGFSVEEMNCKWKRLDRMFTNGTVVCLTVMSYNKGGLLVEWEEMPGFVPTSQLREAPILADDCERMDCLAEYVGQELKLKIIELERAQNRIIFSQRAAGWGECCPDTLLSNLRSGDICVGSVSNLCTFGVFVDLGGVDGLIHISELSWQRVNHPQDVLHIGQRIKVYVIDVDSKRRRIALSLKRLEANPWATVGERYRPGMIVEGVITNRVNFGLFACIEEGVEGLIHISELHHAENGDDSTLLRHEKTGAILTEGTRLAMRILSVDPQNQRIALSLRGIDKNYRNLDSIS